VNIFGMQGCEQQFHGTIVADTVFHCQRKLPSFIAKRRGRL
jgi:hypothetical protein